MRSVLKAVRRLLPVGIPICLLTIAIAEFYRQNHTFVSRQGDLMLTTEAELADIYSAHVAGSDDHHSRNESTSDRPTPVPVARKLIFKKRAGIVYFQRGHCCSFEAQFPEFPAASPFFRELNQKLRDEFEQSATEFATFDGSFIVDGFREPQISLRQWDRNICVRVTHFSARAISALESSWEFTGGLHGNPWIAGRCLVEQHSSVRELKLADLFEPTSNWAKKLVAYCLSDLRCQGASWISDESVADPELARFSAEDLGSFTLSTAGLRFYFSPYHVGTYAEGIYSVFVPYSVVQNCIPEDSPARLFMAAENR